MNNMVRNDAAEISLRLSISLDLLRGTSAFVLLAAHVRAFFFSAIRGILCAGVAHKDV